MNLLNKHHLALFNMEQTHLWLAFWCDFIGALLVVATCLLSVAFSETLGAPNVGLAISNSIQVLVFFTWVVRGVADTVSMWDAIERVTSFATLVGAGTRCSWVAHSQTKRPWLCGDHSVASTLPVILGCA